MSPRKAEARLIALASSSCCCDLGLETFSLQIVRMLINDTEKP